MAILSRAVHEHINLAVIFHPDWHHQEGTGVLIFQENLGNVILVVDDWLPVARADSFQELDQPSLSVLDFAEVDELLNDRLSDLDLKQLFVVVYKRDNGVLCTDVVLSICTHCMIEVQVEPL